MYTLIRKWNNIYKLAHTVRWQIKILPLGLQMLVNRVEISFWCYFFFFAIVVFRMLEWLRFSIMLCQSLCFSFVTYIHEVCKNDSFMKAIFILVLTMFLVSLKKICRPFSMFWTYKSTFLKTCRHFSFL